MLKVTAVEDKNEQSALCRRCALPYLPLPSLSAPQTPKAPQAVEKK